MPPYTRAEQMTRTMIEALYKELEIDTVEEIDAIRGAALSLFVKELELKLRNLQHGETLQVTFRVDIVGSDGKVRGGAGDDRNMPEYIAWRAAVYERDDFTCQECGRRGVSLNAHHIKHWQHHPELRFDLSNGITLCEDCHAKKHPHLRFIKHGPTDEI